MHILFISASKFQSNSAEASRLYYLAQLFAVDNDVCILSRGQADTQKQESVMHVSVSNKKLINRNIVSRALDYCLFTRNIKKFFKKMERADAIVACAMPTSTLKFLIQYTKRNHVILIHDAVEWYSAEEFRFGRFDRLYRKKEKWMRKLLPGNCRIISISQYLKNYFESVGNKSVYIPSIIDTRKYQYSPKCNDGKIKIVYAGTPLRKDYLSVALKGISDLSIDKIKRLEIIIMGVSLNQANENGITQSILDKLGNSIAFLGKVPREEVFENLGKANFSVLLRPADQRYAKAGFPTKVPESMTVGTPVICNFSSDLEDYLTDEGNCVRVDECSAEAMTESMNRVFGYDSAQLEAIAVKSAHTAKERFDYRLYIPEVRRILE